jgi:hypothetical protein
MKRRPAVVFVVETVVPACVGVGLFGYMAYRFAGVVLRAARQAFVEFVSG